MTVLGHKFGHFRPKQKGHQLHFFYLCEQMVKFGKIGVELHIRFRLRKFDFPTQLYTQI